MSSTYTLAEGTTRTDEETSTNGTTDGDHVQMARLHGALELNDTEAILARLEGLEVETIAGPEALAAVGIDMLAGSNMSLALIGRAVAALLVGQRPDGVL